MPARTRRIGRGLGGSSETPAPPPGGGGPSRCGVLSRPNSSAIRPPCVLAPLGPALASRGREFRYSLLGALLATLLLVAAAAAPASAAVKWVVHGHGFGHGVGMSAYGAYGYALHGAGYKAILGHYYPGTSLGTLEGPQTVRVLLGVES